MPTLAELRARKHKSLPVHPARITLDQELLADVQRLEAEKNDLRMQVARVDEDGNRTGPPPKAGQKVPPRLAEIDAELARLYDRLRASEGELLLRGVTGAEWQAFKDEHPPRKDNGSDTQIAYGYCNASDLLNELGRFVVAWDGEELADGDWDGWLRDSIAAGDLRDLVTAVVVMHERSGVRAPFVPTTSPETEDAATD